MSENHEIIPGESIGPFELGMTREQIEALRIEPMESMKDGAAHYFPLGGDGSGQPSSMVRTGVTVEYDASGRVSSITAHFGYSPVDPPVFTLFGEVVNGMTAGKVAGLLRSVAGDIVFGYGTVSSASAGLAAVKWEAIDDEIMCIEITPKE